MNKIQKIVPVVLLISALALAGCSPSPIPQAGEEGGQPSPTEGIQVGDLAPDFELLNLDQEFISLWGLRGNPVALNFWASWCRPCVSEMPYLQEIHEEYSDKGLILLAINIGESSTTVENFLLSSNLSIPVLLDTSGAVAQQYSILNIPTTFFINEDGIIQSKRIGAFIYKEQIENELGKIMPGQ